ncbi:MAG: hypothetical protein OK455_01095 [Thaumarchaeota archaeon]|nr:hypothetical protein [Nitrososphaerota archaeon]
MSEATRTQFKREAYCRYCGGKLNLGYNFTCHVCGETYCYIHLSRHSGAHTPEIGSRRVHERQAVLG